jgi:hypothetical protein
VLRPVQDESSDLHTFETEDVILDEQELGRYLWQRIYGERK